MSLTPAGTSRALTHLTAVIALAVSLLPPLAYFFILRQALIQSLTDDATVQSVLISQVVGRNPDVWRQAHERLVEAVVPIRHSERTTRIVGMDNAVITQLAADLRWPILVRSDIFFDSGVSVGRVEVSASLADVLLGTALVLVFSSVVGFVVFVPLRKMPARALQRASERLLRGELSRSLVDGLSEGVVLIDHEMQVVATNRRAGSIAGMAMPITVGANLVACLGTAVRADGTAFLPAEWPMQRCLATQAPIGPEVVGLEDAGEKRVWLSLNCTPVRHGEQNEHRAVVIAIEDITEHKRNSDQLVITERAVMSAHDAMLITDAEQRVILVNDAYCALTGYENEDVLGQKPSMIRSGRHSVEFYAAMWEQIAATGAWSGEIWNRRCNGDVFPAWLSVSAVRDKAGTLTHFIGTLHDISKRLEAEQQVRHVARHDPLTGLPNRSSLRETLAQALAAAKRHGRRVAVFFLDLDRFKLINDTLGHRTGDAVLIEVAQRLKAALRSEDTVGRLAGDEFAAFASDVLTETAIASIAEDVLLAMSEPISVDGEELYPTISVGISVFPDDGDDVDTLLSNADTAMYAAKNDGRANYKFFTEAMNETGRRHLETAREVRLALERSEFILFYQPQVEAGGDGRVLGAEALIRWQHPQRGMVPPGQFIPVIEGTRMIIEVGNWVLDEALRQVCEWRREGFAVCVSINVSPLQFRQDDFLEILRHASARHDFAAGSIRLEVTESLMLTDPEATIGKMHAVRALGFHLSLDDFGTGYSSLAYLARFPFDEVKIDRSFICQLGLDRTADAIVEAIIVLGHAIELQTIAEGVETDAQAAAVKRLGCDQIQGYLTGRPMPAREFEQRLRAQARPGVTSADDGRKALSVPA